MIPDTVWRCREVARKIPNYWCNPHYGHPHATSVNKHHAIHTTPPVSSVWRAVVPCACRLRAAATHSRQFNAALALPRLLVVGRCGVKYPRSYEAVVLPTDWLLLFPWDLPCAAAPRQSAGKLMSRTRPSRSDPPHPEGPHTTFFPCLPRTLPIPWP